MNAARLLVTGFGPFPGVPVNPTTRLVETIEAENIPGVTAMVLPTEWRVCDDLPIESRAYDAVVMFGVAASTRHIRYERVALPAAAQRPDAAGTIPAPGRLPYRTTRLPVTRLVAAARAAGFPVVLSHSAGTYICNASYGAALGGNPRTLFVHVPLPNRLGPLSQSGLERHAFWLLDHLKSSRH